MVVESRIFATVLGCLGPTDVINDVTNGVTNDGVGDVNSGDGLAVTVLFRLVGGVGTEVRIVLDRLGTTDVDAWKLVELDKL